MHSVIRLGCLLIGFTLLTGCGGVFSWDKVNEVQTVKLDDINDFTGCWYVISAIPTSIEEGAEDSKECYELEPDGTIKTTFTFYRDGEHHEMNPEGRVRWDKDPHGGVWGMKFKWWGWLSLPEMAYLILEFDTVYDEELERNVEVSVVGGPTEDTLWIMAREPRISEHLHECLKSTAQSHYNIDALELMSHTRSQQE